MKDSPEVIAESTTPRDSPAPSSGEETMVSPAFGDGAMPESLGRPNWCAFFFPWAWAIRFEVWWVFAVWTGWVVLRVGSAVVAQRVGSDLLVPEIIWFVILLAAQPFALWVSINANRVAWTTAANRAARPGARPLSRSRTATSEAVQQKWWLFGGTLLLLWSDLTYAKSLVGGTVSGMTRTFTGVYLAVNLAVFSVALALYARAALRRA